MLRGKKELQNGKHKDWGTAVGRHAQKDHNVLPVAAILFQRPKRLGVRWTRLPLFRSGLSGTE